MKWLNFAPRGSHGPRFSSRAGRALIWQNVCTDVCMDDFDGAARVSEIAFKPLIYFGEPGWDRTNDLLIKSQLLYH
jgi:hypothetical protein